MSERHFAHWPRGLPRAMTIPETDLFYNVEVSARRYPDKPFLVFYDTRISFTEFKDEAERIAGWLQQACGVARGDRVLLYMQNSPQFVLAYYGILRAGAVVVPVNPMNLAAELEHYVANSGARVAIVARGNSATQSANLQEWQTSAPATVASVSPTGKATFPTLNLGSLPVYADNAAATAGGLAAGDVYRTSTGVLMVRY